MSYTPEKYQLGILTNYLLDKGLQFSTEVTMYSIPIDLAYLEEDDVVSVELKSKDMKRGRAQAERNLLYADFSYLTLWSSNLSESTIEKFDSSDVGLISVDDSKTEGALEWVSPANRNDPNDYAREKLKDVIMNDI